MSNNMSNNKALNDQNLVQEDEPCFCSKANKIERTCRRCHRTWMGRMSHAERTAHCPTHRLQVCINGSHHLYCRNCNDQINEEVQELLSSKNQIHQKSIYF